MGKAKKEQPFNVVMEVRDGDSTFFAHVPLTKAIEKMSKRVPQVQQELNIFCALEADGDTPARSQEEADALNQRLYDLFDKPIFWARFLGYHVNCAAKTDKEFKAGL